jgi:hypothetical protein
VSRSSKIYVEAGFHQPLMMWGDCCSQHRQYADMRWREGAGRSARACGPSKVPAREDHYKDNNDQNGIAERSEGVVRNRFAGS